MLYIWIDIYVDIDSRQCGFQTTYSTTIVPLLSVAKSYYYYYYYYCCCCFFYNWNTIVRRLIASTENWVRKAYQNLHHWNEIYRNSPMAKAVFNLP